MNNKTRFLVAALAIFLPGMLSLTLSGVVAQEGDSIATLLADSPTPPDHPVKLIFIHHSTGGNWLANVGEHDAAGGLGAALMNNNYFVSATNYGWDVNGDTIGDRTDIGHWWDWFGWPENVEVSTALYNESGQNIGGMGDWSRMAADPGGQNEIVMFKSCFPNSNLGGSPDDPPNTGADNPMRGAWVGDESYTVGNAKGIYVDLLTYFETRQDKLFIVITAPPLLADETDAAQAANAHALNNWLVHDWLDGYSYLNVAVFDFYNVLTSNGGSPTVHDLNSLDGSHHRWWDNQVQHQTSTNNYSSYAQPGDSHPTSAGGQKATAEFVPLLNIYYNRWRVNVMKEYIYLPTVLR